MLHTSDMEFVTNDTCVKYFWARVKVLRINAKNFLFCEISQIQVQFMRFFRVKLKVWESHWCKAFDISHVCHTYVCIVNAGQTQSSTLQNYQKKPTELPHFQTWFSPLHKLQDLVSQALIELLCTAIHIHLTHFCKNRRKHMICLWQKYITPPSISFVWILFGLLHRDPE